jgi:hypothetical protein
MKKRLSLSLHALVYLLAAPAWGARPFFTDDARVVDQGHCQLETFYKEQRAYSGSEFWFLPACNPFGVELTVAGNRIEGEHNSIVQGKVLFKELQPDGIGFAGSVGSFGGDPYLNGIASQSFLDDRYVVHANLGMIRNPDADRGTWGLGLEALLAPPRWYAMLETFGQRGDTPTLHYGLRYWVMPNRFQIDATHGRQSADPLKSFYSIGLRFIF